MQERRAHPRYPMGFGAVVRFGDEEVAAATRDMSLGGCLLESRRPVPESEAVEVSLYLTIDGIREEVPPLRVRGSIRWTAEAEVDGEPGYLSGAQFEGLTAGQSRWLEQVIERYGIA